MEKTNTKNPEVKELLHRYLYEIPKITPLQKSQLNQGNEIVKLITRKGFGVSIRITFQGWQVSITKGGVTCVQVSREHPFG